MSGRGRALVATGAIALVALPAFTPTAAATLPVLRQPQQTRSPRCRPS
jgi:hypothetical protein